MAPRPKYVDVAAWLRLPHMENIEILALDHAGHIFRGPVPIWQDHDHDDKAPPWKSVALPDGARTTAIDVVSDMKGEMRYVAVAGGQVHFSDPAHGDDVSWRKLPSPDTIVDISASKSVIQATIYALDSAGQIWHTWSGLGVWSWSRWSSLNPPRGDVKAIAAVEQYSRSLSFPQPNLLVAATTEGSFYHIEHAPGSDGDATTAWTQVPSPDATVGPTIA